MGNALITIIVPIYNVENYLANCIDSILEQTYQNFELILVDDGSTDKSGQICDEYSIKDNRLRVIHKKNEGVNEARLSGLEISRGAFVTFIDSDDYVSPLYIECLYKPIIEKNVAMSCVQWVCVEGNRMIKDTRKRFGYYDREGICDILRKDFLCNYDDYTTAVNLGLCCKMIKREWLIGAMEVAKGLWIGEDLITNLYLFYHIPSLYISPEFYYFYRLYNGQNTRNCSENAWNNQIEQWKRILLLDKNGYLTEQLPYRILIQTKTFVKNQILQNITMFNFRLFWKNASNSVFYRDNFIKYPFSSLRIIDAVFVFMIKKAHYRTLFFMYNWIFPLAKLFKELKK